MPVGYAEFVQRLGAGDQGHLVRVAAPPELAARTRERGVLVADSFDGDELCFDPAGPGRLVLLSRDEEVLRVLGPGLVEAIDVMLSGDRSGTVRRSSCPTWEPGSRCPGQPPLVRRRRGRRAARGRAGHLSRVSGAQGDFEMIERSFILRGGPDQAALIEPGR